MKKFFVSLLFCLTFVSFIQAESKTLTGLKIVQLEKDMYCAIDNKIIKYDKNSSVVYQLISNKEVCSENKKDAIILNTKQQDKIQKDKIFAKIIHSIALLLLIITTFMIFKYKQKHLYLTLPFIGAFIIIEILFIVFDINTITMILK